jgi:hypothetical protein
MARPPPSRATALASPLSAFAGWFLLPHCARCRVMRQIKVDALADQLGSGTLLRDVAPELRCNRCGDAPRAVLLSDGQGPSAREVWVVGAPR